MNSDRIIILAVLVSLLLGQFGAFEIFSGVRVYLHDALIAMFVLWGLLRQPEKIIIPFYFWPFIGAASLSLVLSLTVLSPLMVVSASLYLVRFLLYLTLIKTIEQSPVPGRVVSLLLYNTALGFALLGFVQLAILPDLRLFSYIGWDPHYLRLFGTLLDPNFMGILLVLGFLLGLGVGNTVGQIVLLVAILVTFSRSTYVGFVAGVLAWGYGQKSKKLVGVVIGALLIGILLLPKSHEWHNLLRTTSAVARIENMQSAWQLFLKHPLFGYGFNTLRFVQCSDKLCEDQYGTVSHAGAGVDNSLLFLAVTTGVLGVGSFLYAIYQLCCEVARAQKKKQSAFVQGFYASLVAVFVHSMFTNSFFYPWVLIWLWVIVGVLMKRENKA